MDRSKPAQLLLAEGARADAAAPLPYTRRAAWAAGAALGSALVGAEAGALPPAAADPCFAAFLVLMAACDIRWRILPDGLTLALLGAGLVAAALGPPGSLLDSAAGAAGGYAAFAALRAAHRALRGAEGMGLGDCKLAAALGAWLGWAALPWVVLAASGAALAVAATSVLAGAVDPLRVRHPFGAYLCAAGLIAWSGVLAP